eukprot:TRINITY_DN106077_c0_g1_i1.p1 TRINITY_DN106077_c0_g1~~TRINITY_DN106077_c0_g1_i1.p1  ORF type:complete len:326 (+),score=69.52 TRINITY_DN106077_c0_g1_i1:164-1141(+)
MPGTLWVGKERIQCLQEPGLEDVAIGCLKAARCGEELHTSAGVTHVINASGLDYPRCSEISYLDLPVDDKEDADISQHFEACGAFIDAARCGEGTSGVVLVHCKAGRSRSASLLAAWLVRSGRSLEEALEAVKRARPIAQPNPGFLEQLRAYSSAMQSAPRARGREEGASGTWCLDLTSWKGEVEVPEMHEIWCWEGDESILPGSWAAAVEECCELSGPLPRIWEEPNFDREGLFFLTHRSHVFGTIVAEEGEAGTACGNLRFWGVHPRERGKGLGRCLLRLALRRHGELGRRSICIRGVLAGSVGEKLLVQEGFERCIAGASKS